MPALQVPQCYIDGAQRLDGQSLLAMIAQSVVVILPVKYGGQRVCANQKRLVKLDNRPSQTRWSERLPPTAQPVLADDLDEQGPAAVVPGLRVGEWFGQRGVEPIGPDIADLHRP